MSSPTDYDHFIPPYPKRHKKTLNPALALYYARRDLLSVWTEDAFRYQFMGRKIFNQPVFIANHPDIVRYVFVEKNKNYERKSPMMRKALDILLGDGLFISDGETWATHRRLQTPLFSSAHVARYSEIMISTTQEMAQRWQQKPAGSRLDVLPEMATLTAEIICRTLFGKQLGAENATEVVSAFSDYQAAIEQMDLSTFLGLPEWIPIPGMNWKKAKASAKRIHHVVDAIIDSSIRERQQKGAHNDTDTTADASLLDLLLLANEGQGDNAISRVQIRNEIIVLFMAGHETTANTLAWAWYLISQDQQVEQKIQQELQHVLGKRSPTYEDYPKLTYIRAVLDETMRLYPPVPILSRQSHEADVIRKRNIPKDSIMLVVPWLLHRHRLYWDQPDHFMPERFLANAPQKINKFTYLPFSLGPRVCLGKYFGQVELVLCLAVLAQQFRLTLPKNTPVHHDCRLTLRPQNGLPMTLEKR